MEPDTSQVVFIIIDFALAFCVLCSVGILAIYQMYCITQNQTNIEAWEKSKVDRLVKRGKIPKVNYPFDVGVYENICQVLGSNPLVWFLPQTMKGDGLTFPLAPGTDPKLAYFWPPRDPEDLRPSIFSSKYKRQQQQQYEDDDDDEDYYDSGSFISESDEEQRLYHDEDNIPLANFTATTTKID